MKKCILFLAVILFLIPLPAAYSATTEVVLLTKTFTRGAGDPIAETVSFPAAAGPAVVKLINGDAEDSTAERVSSSVITVNGATVFDASNFNQNVTSLTKTIDVKEGSNTLSVKLNSKPGGKISIQITLTLEAGSAAKVTTLLFSDALTRGDIQNALTYFVASPTGKFEMKLTALGPQGMYELGRIIEASTPVYIGERYAEYEGVIELPSGEKVAGSFTMVLTPSGWKFNQM